MENLKTNKIIAIGEEAISTLDKIKNNIHENIDVESINLNQDVDKEFVRNLLDGIDLLFVMYSSNDQRTKDIVKAVSFMAEERRIASVGLDLFQDENKDDLGMNQEIKINEGNLEYINKFITSLVDSIDDNCTISIDVTDIKEIIINDKGIKYSYNEFNKSTSLDEVANKAVDSLKNTKDESNSKKGLVLVEVDNTYDAKEVVVEVYELVSKINDLVSTDCDLIFTVYLKDELNCNMKVTLLHN